MGDSKYRFRFGKFLLYILVGFILALIYKQCMK
jgi:hypothetical protein